MRRVHQLGCHIMTSSHPMGDVIRYAALLDRLNFDHVRVGDHTLTPDSGSQYPNAQALLSVFGSLTKHVRISTGVTDTFRRHPAEIAQWVATEDHLTDGRVILGLGGGEKMNITPFGIDYDRPLTRLREAIEVIRLLWTASPKAPADYEGDVFRLRKAYLQIRPVQKPTPPLYVGALSKGTRELAGELADGWVIVSSESPAMLREHIEDVRRGASRAKRRKRALEIVATVYTDITDDQEGVRRSLGTMIRYGLVMGRETLKKRAGIEVPQDLTTQRMVPSALTSRRIASIASRIPAKLVEDVTSEVTAIGTPDQCIEKMEEYLDAGATSIMMCNISKDQERVFRTYANEVIPYLRKEYGEES